MNLTKKEREEITQVYDTWLNSYLSGDVKTYDSYFDDAYHFIGSTDNEDFLDRRSTTKFLEETADQLAGKVQIKNNRRILEKFGGLIFVTELLDAYFLIEGEWTYYGKFRFTSALQKNKEGWRFIYQHFSTPDSKAKEGETIGTEKIAAENLMLREAVQRRTVELEQRKHELEVEAALEKVRARAMAMQRPEELKEVAVLLRNEMGSLGVEELETSSIYLMDGESADCWYAIRDVRNKKNKLVSDHMTLRLQDTWVGREMEAFYHSKQKQTSIAMKGENRKEWINYCASRSSVLQGYYGSEIPERTYHLLKFAGGFMGAASPGDISVESRDLLQRSAKVFSLAYTRFRDLQQASARAREIQIELALERTRNHSMLMQHSDEIKDLSKIFHEQLVALNIPSEFSYIWLPDERKGEHMFWATWSESKSGKPVTMSKSVIYPLDKSEPYTAACFEAWESDIPVHVTNISPGEIVKFFTTWKDLVKGAKNLKANNFPEGIYYAESYMRYGCFGINIRRPLNEEEKDVLFRFTVEFERAYTRFLDLKKAEEQAREAQVEAALERIRAQVTAMQESSELLDIVVMMQAEFIKLGHEAHYFWHMRWLPDKYEKALTNGEGTRIGNILELPRGFHGLHHMLAWEESDEPSGVFALDPETAADYIDKMITMGRFQEIDHSAPGPDDVRSMGGLTFVMARTTHGEIGYTLPGEVPNPSEQDVAILVRFAGVFDLAYRRFEDLKTAEQRNRETQIELALERVRARTMGMKKSDELKEAAMLLFQQVKALRIPIFGCGFNIWEDDRKVATAWMAGEDRIQPPFKTSSSEDIFQRIYEAAEKGDSLFIEEQGGEALKVHYDYMNSIPVFKEIAEKMANVGQSFPTFQIMHCAYFSMGYLMFISYEPVPDSYDIFKRFAKVFEQTYTRFLDLQKAEKQAREAQIEAALEKVRSRTMAMQHSSELQEASDLLFRQIRDLGVPAFSCGYNVWEKGEQECTAWMSDPSGGGMNPVYHIPLTEDENFIRFSESKQKGEEFYVLKMRGERMQEHYRYLRKIDPEFDRAFIELEAASVSLPETQVHHLVNFDHGNVMFITLEPVPEAHDIFRRFGRVFEQTYTRYLDLQKTEKQAREANKQASLDRVRGQIASMRDSEDLQHITPLIWRELKTLEVPFFRCGIFIINEKEKNVHVYLTTPVGSPLAALHLAFDSSELTRNTVASWRKNIVYQEHWNREEFIAWMKEMMKLRQIKTEQDYQGAEAPPDSLHLHFIPFAQGMLYVGNTEQLPGDKIDLVKSLAEAFSYAYARYQDFVVLEEAKAHVEKALTDLKSTQSQLIHSEKMASLGELTAGIAHEIQNPLNFVNNFSEVSAELVDEMKEGLAVGNWQLAKEIADDIKHNLDKINHHGKRADGIVKGMLQHSRNSNGQKESTDLNALADEYLRLAYHGMRAKDHSFNADYRLEADEQLPKVNVVPQDIGRVLLNLVNNAFFAVSDKSKQNIEGYKPEVIVTTHRTSITNNRQSTIQKPLAGDLGKNGIEIRVKDNGNGIPDSIKEKIFQPFFTTKPTGEGTGLGLSMSYDIITKGHGGELKVETMEGEGTEFIIVFTTSA